MIWRDWYQSLLIMFGSRPYCPLCPKRVSDIEEHLRSEHGRGRMAQS